MSEPPLDRRIYTIDEVAALLGLSRNSTFVAAREGRLPVPVIRIGQRMMVSRTALDRFLETGDGTVWRRRKLIYAARDLIALAKNCPELFERVLPISEENMQELCEIAGGDDDAEAEEN
jgi:excisionase family DNA binding protein